MKIAAENFKKNKKNSGGCACQRRDRIRPKNSNFPDFPNMKVDEAKIGIAKIGKMIESVLKVQKYMCKVWPEIPNLGYEGRKDFSDPAK